MRLPGRAMMRGFAIMRTSVFYLGGIRRITQSKDAAWSSRGRRPLTAPFAAPYERQVWGSIRQASDLPEPSPRKTRMLIIVVRTYPR